MNFLHKIFSSKKVVFIFGALVLSAFFGKLVFATPPASFYDPGETLNPDCLPTDTNCDVAAPLTASNISDTAYDEATWNGVTTIAPSKNAVRDQIEILVASNHDPVTLGTANGLSLATQVLSLALASTSTTGALSDTDWDTFNDKANPALSNLSATAINTSLISDTTNTDDLGSSAIRWKDGFFGTSLVVGDDDAEDVTLTRSSANRYFLFNATGTAAGDAFRIHNFSHPTGNTGIPSGYNLFIGNGAGNFTMGSTATLTTHASNNIGIGFSVLSAVTTGSDNTCIGNYSDNPTCDGLTTGSSNVIIGASTGSGTITGQSNTFIRGSAAGANVSGNHNVSIGYEAFGALSSGSNNLAMPIRALKSVTTGSDNVGLGNGALYAVTTTSSNVGIGATSGRYLADGSTANQTPTNSLYLGPLTKSSAAGQSNEIVIGYDAIGNGSNTATIGNTDLTNLFIGGTTNTADLGSASNVVRSGYFGTSIISPLLGTATGNVTFAGATDADDTKKLAFDLTGITTGTTRTITWPDADVTIPSSFASLGTNTFTGIQQTPTGAATTVYYAGNDVDTGISMNGNTIFFVGNGAAAASMNSATFNLSSSMTEFGASGASIVGFKKSVAASSTNTLSAGLLGRTYYDAGNHTLTLHSAVAGHWFDFVIINGNTLRIQANTGDNIRIVDDVTATAGYIESSTIGSVLRLEAVDATTWVAKYVSGVWTDGTFTVSEGANSALSNLASVAINTSLISDTANTDDLGSSAITWRSGYFGTSVISPLYDRPEPAAAAGASQAGLPISITASDAVASTDTAGAAAGGSLIFTAGSAARLTSGNADAGHFEFKSATGIGTGVGSQILQYNHGTAARPAYAFDISGNRAYGMWYSGGAIKFSTNGTLGAEITGSSVVTGGLRNHSGSGISLGHFYGFANGRFNLTSSATLTALDYNQSTLTNAGAGSAITSTMPGLHSSLSNHFRFIDNNDTYRWTVKADAADQIVWPDGTVSDAAGVTSAGRYNTLSGFGVDADTFVVTSTTGTWTDGTNTWVDGRNIAANFGIGISPTYKLDVLASGTGIIARFQSDNATGCTLVDGGTITCTSDERMKKNIEDISYGLETIKGLRPVLFNWKYEDPSNSSGQAEKNLGFIAQEVEALIPKLIATDENGMKSLNTTAMVPILTKAIQEMDLKITEINNVEQENTWRDSLIAWFGSVGNGIGNIFAKTFRASEQLCINDTCVTEAQLQALLQNSGTGSSSPASEPEPVIEEPAASADESSDEPMEEVVEEPAPEEEEPVVEEEIVAEEEIVEETVEEEVIEEAPVEEVIEESTPEETE
jgi:hypothetical protein